MKSIDLYPSPAPFSLPVHCSLTLAGCGLGFYALSCVCPRPRSLHDPRVLHEAPLCFLNLLPLAIVLLFTSVYVFIC